MTRLASHNVTAVKAFPAARTALATAAVKLPICCANQFPTWLSTATSIRKEFTARTIADVTNAVATLTRPSQTCSHHGFGVGGSQDDVQNVWSNFDIPAEMMESA